MSEKYLRVCEDCGKRIDGQNKRCESCKRAVQLADVVRRRLERQALAIKIKTRTCECGCGRVFVRTNNKQLYAMDCPNRRPMLIARMAERREAIRVHKEETGGNLPAENFIDVAIQRRIDRIVAAAKLPGYNRVHPEYFTEALHD